MTRLLEPLRVRVLERELAVPCHRQVVVGGCATATGTKLAIRQGR
jgi:hypothetical protein